MFEHLVIDRTKRTGELSQTSGILRTSIQRILKFNRLHPFKMKLMLGLNGDGRRLQFSGEMRKIKLNVIQHLFFRTSRYVL